jgi:hypothetical protein
LFKFTPGYAKEELDETFKIADEYLKIWEKKSCKRN